MFFAPVNCTHLDLNITRAIDFDHKFTDTKNSVISPQDLYLDTLATHPSHQLHGSGTRLVRSGIARGKKQGVNVTLIAQPTAKTFYEHLGFVNTVNVSISRVGGEGKAFRFNVMRYGDDEEEGEEEL
jgi:predicted N-acetyltransferase YhbS